ncbi:MAG: late secretory pathway protein avl9 [Alyxoria varia]|nr:MAG: late secretory pathway protein avl9 [Alyxoria varia]
MQGPEVEKWFGLDDKNDPTRTNDWALLPFLALPDGSHASDEELSYFTFKYTWNDRKYSSSLFGISCTRHIDANELVEKSSDVTRSSVQKAIVAIVDTPYLFARIREKLSAVTKAWFAQRNFSDIEIVELPQQFHLNLLSSCDDSVEEKDQYGSLFGPYTPLQQLDVLGDFGTKSYIAGSTNSLLLQQKDKYSDVLINLDDLSIGIFSPALRSALSLSAADRRWIDFITQSVNETWDEANPSRPNTHGYAGSEDFIRLQFEEYLLAMLAAVKYRQYVDNYGKDPKALLEENSQDPAVDFGSAWLDAWMTTENYKIFNKATDPNIFDIVEPRHPCAGGLTIEDVQRRVAQQISDLNLESHYRASRETLSKHLSTSQAKFSSAINGFWAEVEAQKQKRAAAAAANAGSSIRASSDFVVHDTDAAARAANGGATTKDDEKEIKPLSRASTTDEAARQMGGGSGGLTKAQLAQGAQAAQQSMQAAGSRASAYLGTWGSWAAERRKQGWGKGNGHDSTSSTTGKKRDSQMEVGTEIAAAENKGGTGGDSTGKTAEGMPSLSKDDGSTNSAGAVEKEKV